MPDTTDSEIERVLQEAKTIAVVGLSPNPNRPSFGVANYLAGAGYRIIPVNPGQDEVMGLTCYPSLDEVPDPVDIVDIFLKPERIPEVVDAAIRKGAKCIWMQLGIEHEEAAKKAGKAGLTVVMDHCTKIEHIRLIADRDP